MSDKPITIADRRIGRVTLPDPMLNGIRNADVFFAALAAQ